MNAIAPTVAAAMLAWFAASAPPDISSVSPLGGQRGTEVTVTFRGVRLDGVHDVLLPRAGLELVAVTADKPDRCTAVLRVPRDCPLGSHPLRLVTAHGIAPVCMFQVGVLSEVNEADGDAVQTIALETTVNGSVRGEETDRYAFPVTAGQRVVCEVQAMRLGRGPIDLALEVRGPDGARLAAADDTAFAHKDPWVQFTAAATGTCEVHVAAAFPDSANRGPYRLHVGTFPRPVAARPAGGAPGQTLDVTLIEADGSELLAQATLPDDGSPFVAFTPETERGAAPTPLVLQVDQLPTTPLEVDAQGRGFLPRRGVVDGVVSQPDQDARLWFRAEKGERIEFRCLARTLRSELDPLLIARYANGRYISSDDDGLGAGDSKLRFQAPETGEFVLDVRDLMRGGSPLHVFRLEIGDTPSTPRTSLVTGRREDAALNVPQGGSAGGVLRVDDIPTDQGLQFVTDQVADLLPAGVTATFGALQKGSNQVPFVCTAAADAPLAATLVRLQLLAGQGDDAAVRDAGYLQSMPLVTVRNDRPILGALQTRLPVAVTQPLPFSLELEPLAVPLVRDGRAAVRVRVHRTADDKTALRVRALWSPAGVGTGQITIPGDKDEGILPIEASSSAALGAFPLAVLATSGRQGSELVQASTFVDVRVERPWAVCKLPGARTTQGKDVEFVVALTPSRTFDGPVRAVLSGLPRGVSAAPLDLPADAAEARFAVRVAEDATPGRHQGLRVELHIPHAGDFVIQRYGGGELRIDRPAAADQNAEETAR